MSAALTMCPGRPSDPWRDECARLLDTVAGLRARVRELEAAATTDELTGLLNRRGAQDALHAAMKRHLRHGVPVSVVLVDVDHFKRVNDVHGHARGDEVLRRVADVVRDELRATDAGIRWGGEEFLVVTENDAQGAAALAGRLRRALRRVYADPEGREVVTASFGVAEYDGRPGDEPLSHTVEEADRALYRAKRTGRNRVAVARPKPFPPGVPLS